MADVEIRSELVAEAFDPAGRLAAFLESLGHSAGAVVTFTGLTRGQAKDGGALRTLFLEHHPTMTASSLRDIAEEGSRRFAVSAVEVVHRCGAIPPGEPIVWVAAASAHRRAAFDAADYLMDRLKTEAVFWKREDGPEGSLWIEPTEDDYDMRGRWS